MRGEKTPPFYGAAASLALWARLVRRADEVHDVEKSMELSRR